jgi:YidC/Oxa1 family membrane protein insertase
MHRNPIVATVLMAIGMLAASVTAGAQANKADAAFAPALKMERDGNHDGALQAYDRVFRDNNNKDKQLAAEALYRRGEYSWKRFGTTDAEKKRGLDDAFQSWKQLRDSLDKTDAGKRLTDPTADYPQGPLVALEAAIDKRNSTELNYKVIDSLVALTGRIPSLSYGFALILLAVVVKLLLLPLTKRQYGSMREMQKMQPLIKDLQKRFKGQELQKAQMELYKEHNVNPFAGCLPSLLQLPFLFWIFAAIRQYEIAFGKGTFLWIGSPLAKQYPGVVAKTLAEADVPLLTVYVITNYITMRMTPAQDPQQQEQQKMMALITSGMFFYMFLSYKWSSAFVLYWFALNLLSIWQQYVYVYKPHKERQLAVAPEAGGTTTSSGTSATSKNGGSSVPDSAPTTIARPQPARVRPRKKRK